MFSLPHTQSLSNLVSFIGFFFISENGIQNLSLYQWCPSTFKTYQLWLLLVILHLWIYISFRMSVPFISQNIISDHNINYQSAIFYQLSFYQWSQFSKKYQFSLLSVISTLLKCISYQLSVVPNFQILSVAYISALIKKRPTDKKNLCLAVDVVLIY